MTVLVDRIQLITSSLDLDEVLENIIWIAIEVIPSTDAGHLILFDEETVRRRGVLCLTQEGCSSIPPDWLMTRTLRRWKLDVKYHLS